MLDVSPMWETIIVLGILVVNSYVVSAKAAFEALNEAKFKRMEKEEVNKINLVKKIYEVAQSYINPFDVFILITTLIMGIFSCNLIFRHLGDWLRVNMTFQYHFPVRILCYVISICLMIYLYIFVGNLIPTRIGTKNAEKIVVRDAKFVRVAFQLIKPLTSFIAGSMKLWLRICHVRPEDYEENITEDEIISIVSEGQEQGVLEASEAEMISNIMDFSEKEARDIMTPKIKIVAVNAEMSLQEALEFMVAENYSRYPLYEENRDNIIGILYLKDVTNYYVKKKNRKISLKEIAREPYFIPDTQNIPVLFHELQRRKIHMAIAIDEYGQTAGLVAMEDIIEEIVGNIQDEYDEEERPITPVGEGTYLVKGYTTLEELNDEIGLDVDTEDFDTLNGLLISLLSRILNDGETEVVSYRQFRFEILEIKNKVIELVKITKLENEELPDETENFVLD